MVKKHQERVNQWGKEQDKVGGVVKMNIVQRGPFRVDMMTVPFKIW